MAQFKPCMLYLRLSEKTMYNLFQVLKPKISIRDKDALTVVCEELLEWATTEAAKGKYASEYMERKYGDKFKINTEGK